MSKLICLFFALFVSSSLLGQVPQSVEQSPKCELSDTITGQHLDSIQHVPQELDTVDLISAQKDSSDSTSANQPDSCKYSSFKVFPNPFQDRLFIRTSGKYTGSLKLLIFDSRGKQVFFRLLEGIVAGEDFEVSGLDLYPGIYYLRFQGSRAICYTKLVRL